MIGKIVGALAGSQVAKTTKGMDSPMGAALGVVAATALRRMSLPSLIAVTAGGYFMKKYFDGQEAQAKLKARP